MDTSARGTWDRGTWDRIKRTLLKLLGRSPEPPEDPYSYVGAPRKPRPPHLSAAAVAERPRD